MGSDQKPKKLPWGIDKPKPGSVKKIADTKLQAFSVGINKKTAFQKQQEEAALRKKQEEDEAAKVYAEFVASFDQDASKPKGWVKGGVIMPKGVFDSHEVEESKQPAAAKPTLYMPQPFVKASAAVDATAPKLFVQERNAKPLLDEDVERNVPKPQRKRNLDMFLEELKRDQEDRDERLRSKHARHAASGVDQMSDSGSLTLRAAFEERPGSHDTGDPDTTNLYVGNINIAVDEDLLCQEFGRYGPIASVKIMWPRTQEEKERNRNCGFVSFMTREAAQEALKNLDGKDLRGNVLKVGWGKSVTLPPKPVYVHPTAMKQSRAPSGYPFNAQLGRSVGGFGAVPPPNALKGAHAVPAKGRLDVEVLPPADRETTMIIHRFIERVVKHGPHFEALIMDRERDNTQFGFLFQHDSPEHVYYRWKLYSILQGDRPNKWPTDPFEMFDDGIVWTPPEVPFDDDVLNSDEIWSSTSDSEDSNSESEQPRSKPKPGRNSTTTKGTLPPKSRLRLESMLRNLTFDRHLIGRSMVFCLSHALAADDVISTLIKSLLIPQTPIFPTKIARLYLLSDILHNTATPIPNAWKYRMGFEKRLVEVFEHLGEVRRGVGKRLRREQMRRAVCEVLGVWEGWIVYPEEFVEKLREAFLRDGNESEDAVLKGNEGHALNDSPTTTKRESHPETAEGGVTDTNGGFVKSKWTSIDSQPEDDMNSNYPAPATLPTHSNDNNTPTPPSSLHVSNISSSSSASSTPSEDGVSTPVEIEEIRNANGSGSGIQGGGWQPLDEEQASDVGVGMGDEVDGRREERQVPVPVGDEDEEDDMFA
ncbi:uncharacterized protein EV422DRAFT_622733 [Fimicolochytrium jonesii]|uniref:uncharacterized protein n=1 Tax=Fimicolochytrium jonesii TaxID=1396493 RepID=UPI0022FE9566|nr:uncharacterized protein EV422DRAFT_622733 [Fimicolochytrium jonesii]KAI8817249.1 hypothetical protein EV422DRAFT_622733 [Fimicolochytrium jonesii]